MQQSPSVLFRRVRSSKRFETIWNTGHRSSGFLRTNFSGLSNTRASRGRILRSLRWRVGAPGPTEI